MAGAAALAGPGSVRAGAPPRLYRRVRLVDIHGTPIKAGALVADTNYVFQYPFAATPCFLLRLPTPAAPRTSLRREDGGNYDWSGGVGADRSVVAFSATTLVQHNAFEMKPAKLTIINTGYQLALFLAMSLVIGLL